MNANNTTYRVEMLNSKTNMSRLMKYVDLDLGLKKSNNKVIVDNDTIIYILLNSAKNIIGVISLSKMLFNDFQNDANNDKVYAFGIKIEDEYKYLSPSFISEVWNDFINIKRNFIFWSSLTYNKELIEDLNELYNIYYQLNLENISLIFGPKVVGKKKYLKIKDGKDVKNNKLTKNRFNKSKNQKGHINAYLKNYPNNNPNQNIIESTSNNNNNEKPLLGKKPSRFLKLLKKMGFKENF